MRYNRFGRGAYRARLSGDRVRSLPQVLQKQGYEVTYARNYTDVDDKIIARAKEANVPADEYAQVYADISASMEREIDEVVRKAGEEL